MGEDETRPLFVALASVLAAIESGVIAEGEVEERMSRGEVDTILTISVCRDVRPVVAGASDG